MTWAGIGILAVGLMLYAFTFIWHPAKFRRVMNANVKKLEEMRNSGEAEAIGEGADELFQRAIDYQLKNQCGPVPLVRPAIALVVVGLLVTVIGFVTG